MRLPHGLRKLDDRVLGRSDRAAGPAGDGEAAGPDDAHHHVRTETSGTRRGDGPAAVGGDGLSQALAVVWRVSRLVLLAIGLVLLAAVAFVLLPVNEDNVLVRNGLALAEQVAGPFRDLFAVEDPDRARVYDYGLAAVVAFVLASLVGRLPTGRRRT